MSFTEALESAARAAAERVNINEGDYIGEDGLLHCASCHKNKQTKIVIGGKERVVYCICDCREAELAAEKAAEAERERRTRIAGLRSACFSERAMEKWSFENDDGCNPKLTAAMERYVENFGEYKSRGKGLLLCGSCGTGKTYAACEVANALIDREVSVKVTNFSRVLNELQGTYDRQGYLDALNAHSLLVIDDLGVERGTDFAREQVFNVIDGRYRTGLPMIITTNLSLSEINKAPDAESRRIYDRILERCHPISVNGASHRRQRVRNEYEATRLRLGL